MRILLISQYFSPEITAASARLEPWAEGLAALGHEVEVICEVPSHPTGTVDPSWRGRLIRRRMRGRVSVTYLRNHASPSRRARHRLLSYASFAALGLIAGAACRRPDVVIASSPPLSVAPAAALVAARHRVPWVMDVRDVWPEVAIALGELPEGRLADLAERLERRLYASAAAIITPTDPFARQIASRAPASRRIEVVPNGTTREWLELGEAGSPASSRTVEDAYVWTYAGNVGLSQGLGTLLEAARRLGPGFLLQIVGEGGARAGLEKNAHDLVDAGLVRFTGLVEPLRAAKLLRRSDACVLSLADDPVLARSVPVKLYDYAAIGRPLIVSAPGEAARLTAEHELGLVAQPGDAVAVAEAVRSLRADASLGDSLVGRARRFASENLRERQISRIESILSDVVGR